MIQGDKNMGEDREGRAAALLPILIFLLIFLGSGFITGDFYSMPAIVAFLIALLAALVQNRELGFSEKIKLAAQGVGDENIKMCIRDSHKSVAYSITFRAKDHTLEEKEVTSVMNKILNGLSGLGIELRA